MEAIRAERNVSVRSLCTAAQNGQHPSLGPPVERPLERRLHSNCFRSVSPLSVLPKVRQEGQADSRRPDAVSKCAEGAVAWISEALVRERSLKPHSLFQEGVAQTFVFETHSRDLFYTRWAQPVVGWGLLLRLVFGFRKRIHLVPLCCIGYVQRASSVIDQASLTGHP